MPLHRFSKAVLVLLLALALAAPAMAQTDVTTSRISGTVSHDGSALPGVTVEAKNQDTGFAASAVSGPDGSYRVVNLPTGRYTLTATLSGFNRVSRPNLDLKLGSAPTVNFTLQMASVAETITVTSRASIVEVTNTQASTTIETEQLKSLPINGRNFTQLVLLTPQTSIERERGTVAISGQRGINTQYTVDGVDYTNSFFGGPAGGGEGRAPLSISQESIKEFTVITNGASVEFGRSAGGFVNVITRGGTNQLKGSGFYYQQPQSLISDFANGAKPADQSKKQFGGSLGGPLMHDRLFYFGSWDQQKQSRTINIDPTLLSFMPQITAKYPQLVTDPQYIQTQDGRVLFGRADLQATPSQRFMLRANFVKYNGDNGTSASSSRLSTTNGAEGLDTKAYVGSWSSQWGNSALNDASATLVNEDTPRAAKNDNMPEIQFSGYTFGAVSFLPITSTVKRKAVSDTFSYLWKNHVFKAGADYNDTSVAQIFKGNWRGVFVFDGNVSNATQLANFLNGRWSEYRQFGGLGGLTADQAGGVNFGQKETALFAQDQWYLRPNMTLSAGVRWEKLDNPDAPVLNRNQQNADGTYAVNGKIPDVTNQWSPRLGLTWSPGDGKTVLRTSIGRFWSRTPALLWSQLYSSNGVRGTQYNISARSGSNVVQPTDPLSPAWGTTWSPVGVERIDFTKITRLAAPGVFVVDPQFTNPRTDRYTFGAERELIAETAVGLEFTYAKTVNLERLSDLNLAYDGTAGSNGTRRYGARPNRAYDRITQYTSDAESHFQAIATTFRRRFAEGFRAFAQVTYSRDRDNDSNERNFSGIQLEDVNDLDLSWGWANRDQRWKGSVSAVWDTPWWGIGLSGAYRYGTGTPWTPGLGVDANNDRNSGPDRPTLGCATPAACKLGEGTHLGRNSERQPAFASLDLRLGKTFRLPMGGVTLFAECFNCSNRANWEIPGGNQRYGTPVAGRESEYATKSPNANYGLATTPGTPRTWQIAARVDF